MALGRRATKDALGKRRAVSAVTIQTAARRRAAIAKHGPRLTLGAARRKREARAAAEAARPRRRWNRGGTASGPGSATATPPPTGTGTGAGAGAGAGGGSGGGNGAAKGAAATSSQRVASRNSGGPAALSPSSPPPPVGSSSSSRKKLEKGDIVDKEPAHAWEQGPPNPATEAGGKSEGGGGGAGAGDSNGSAPNSGAPRTDDGNGQRSSSPGETVAADGGRGDESVHGGPLPAAKKRASQEASLHFVRESIDAAVVKAGARVPVVGGELGAGVALATFDVAVGDLAATGVSTEAVVVPADGDLSTADREGVPVAAAAGSASKPAA